MNSAHLNKNSNFVVNIILTALLIFGLALMPSVITAIKYGDTVCQNIMFAESVICILVGYLGSRYFTSDISSVKPRTCYLATTITWGIMIILSIIPFYTAGYGYTIEDSLFEACAGWSTTGASVIRMDTLPLCLQLWKCTCNWMGGLGIILLSVTFIKSWQFTGQTLVSTEVPGPQFMKSTMTFRKSYRRILGVYTALTLLQFILLTSFGMPVFRSLETALSIQSSAGLQHFSVETIIGFSPAIKGIITIFTIFSSVNLAIFAMLLGGEWRKIVTATELNGAIIIAVISTALLTCANAIENGFGHMIDNLCNSFMQIVSFMSTSGYIITDIDGLPEISVVTIAICCIIGASAFSTGGGIKVARFICAMKSIKFGIYRHIHPRIVKTQKYNGVTIANKLILKSLVYIFLFFSFMIFSALALAATGADLESSLAAAVAMLTNTGTAINHLGNNFIYSGYGTAAKIIMSILMIGGRLEIYPLLLILSAGFFRTDKAD